MDGIHDARATYIQEPNGAIPEGDARFYQELLNGLDDGVYFVDHQRRILFWNKGAERITGYTSKDVIGRSCAENILMHVDESGHCLCNDGCPLAASIHDGGRRVRNLFLHHKDGHRVPITVNASPVHDRNGRIMGGFETFHDTSATQADLQRIRELEQLAYLDDLTGIANRRYLDNSLDARLADAAHAEGVFGIIMLDVDRFKRFNDNYGHEVGDRVLQMVAHTIGKNSRPFDTVGRWGGEEFVILVKRAKQQEVTQHADKIRILVEQSSLTIEDQCLIIRVSAGATIARPDDDRHSLITRVDRLLYRSKNDGRNRVTFGD